MIIFEKVKFKNFLSFGNKPIEIDLNSDNTTCIIGKNASGKSVFMDAITYALFNKAYRPINKPQLVNSFNDNDCLVEIDFKIGKSNWKIIRGQKPTIFEIYKDGGMLNQSHSAIEQQRWLEQNVLKMNYKSFTQIVILGNSNFTPFMQLTPANRREVIEELLDIKIFSSMNSVIKEKIKETKDAIKILEVKKNLLADKIELQKNFISEVEKDGNDTIKIKELKIDSLAKTIQSLLDEIQNKENESSELLNRLNDIPNVSTEIKKQRTLKGKVENKKEHIESQIQFFSDNISCPTCTQSIEEILKNNKVKDLNKDLKKIQKELELVDNEIKENEQAQQKRSELKNQISEIDKTISYEKVKINQYEKQITELKKEITIVQTKIKNQHKEHQKLEQFEIEYADINKQYLANIGKNKYYDQIQELLKDTGVKSRIIKKYIPLINKEINRYLQLMDFYINFNLNENFEEVINTPLYTDFNYSSFSEGQKQRINLALLFTWREVARIKNSTNVNLLILDEVFDSSLDSAGTDDFLKIIKNKIKKSNIFVISHKENIQSRFDKVIEFHKKGNFSYIKSS